MSASGEAAPAAAKWLPPPVVLLGALVAMAALYHFAPGPELVPVPWNRLGWLGFAFYIGMALYVFLAFRKAGTTIKPHEAPSALVTSGPFAWSRNPIYVAMVAAVLGFAVALGTAAPLVVAPAFAWIVQRRFIAVEERGLEDAFGDAYRAYKSRVRRWI